MNRWMHTTRSVIYRPNAMPHNERVLLAPRSTISHV